MEVLAGPRGVVLPGPRLALDDAVPGHASVCSHAHADHVPWEATGAVHCTPATADLLARRAPHLAAVPHPEGEPFRLGEARVTFHPSGHVLGAALTLVEWGGTRLLYTADVKLREPFTCAPCARGIEADVLVVESTFGLPIFRFPPSAELARRAVAFAREALAEGATPVFLGYNLGKAQELMAILGRAGVPVSAHGAAWNLARVYEARGVALPNCAPYDRDALAGRALVVPPGARANAMVTRLDARVAYASGWAAIENRRVQLDLDLLLPLSDHLDFPDALRFVEETGAPVVHANHGHSDALARVLRGRGYEAEALHAGRFDEEETQGLEEAVLLQEGAA